MFAGDSQTLLNKRHLIISVIAINVFYCTLLSPEFNNRSQTFSENKWCG